MTESTGYLYTAELADRKDSEAMDESQDGPQGTLHTTEVTGAAVKQLKNKVKTNKNEMAEETRRILSPDVKESRKNKNTETAIIEAFELGISLGARSRMTARSHPVLRDTVPPVEGVTELSEQDEHPMEEEKEPVEEDVNSQSLGDGIPPVFQLGGQPIQSAAEMMEHQADTAGVPHTPLDWDTEMEVLPGTMEDGQEALDLSPVVPPADRGTPPADGSRMEQKTPDPRSGTQDDPTGPEEWDTDDPAGRDGDPRTGLDFFKGK